ncbi:hypothetical protein GF1_24710 [Desulfolithobacter dissulfuricans]|uniref:Uncharacterized protein n=1 Tax=Desulfolithobacter dissulfuricans TaxID=2795293 RepID=A0A915U3C4_9BACT|nr:hypothetical protein GF1_24710 [Desulfolithobacter dissulfuricans]
MVPDEENTLFYTPHGAVMQAQWCQGAGKGTGKQLVREELDGVPGGWMAGALPGG